MTPRLWTFRSSPFAGKARAAFHEKGIAVELVEIHPVRRPPRLRELNPLNRVPVLETGDDGDPPIRESSLICEWLEETYPDPPLWPQDAALRGWARGWAKYLDDVPSVQFFLGLRKQAFGRDPGDPEDITEQLHAKVARSWPYVERALAVRPGPWLCGEQLTLADLSGMPLAVRLPEWAPHLQPDEAQTPLTATWMAALRQRPSAAAIDQAGPERLSA